jgi:hypothetical protein
VKDIRILLGCVVVLFAILIAGSPGDSLWDSWSRLQLKAESFSKQGKFLEASEIYRLEVMVVIAINDPVRTPVLKSWALNNQAYMIIKEHMKVQKGKLAEGYLKKAKLILVAAKGVKGIPSACLKCVDSNLSYVNDWINILSPTVPKKIKK